MTIHKTAYDTFVCRDFVMTKVQHALDAVYYTGQLHTIPGSTTLELQGGSPLANEVPAFAHPFQVTKTHASASGAAAPALPVVVDARAFGKYDSHVGQFVVRNRTEYEFLLLRGRLNSVWLEEAPSLLLNAGPLGMKLYAAWISDNIGHKLSLDPREKLTLQVYAAFFYWSLFQEQHPLNAVTKHRAVAAILKATGLPAKEVNEVLDHFEQPVSGVEEFCALAHEVVRSVRLKQLSVGFLFAALGNTWFNSNSKEITAVALEHPPTWIAMVCTASQDRSFKNTGVNRLLEIQDRAKKGADYARAVKNVLRAAQA